MHVMDALSVEGAGLQQGEEIKWFALQMIQNIFK